MKGIIMKKSTVIAVATTLAILFVIGKDANKQKEIDDLKARLNAVGRFSDLYYDTLSETVNKLDREDRRETVRKFNENVDFIRVTNRF
jgi:hypothetical protein